MSTESTLSASNVSATLVPDTAIFNTFPYAFRYIAASADVIGLFSSLLSVLVFKRSISPPPFPQIPRGPYPDPRLSDDGPGFIPSGAIPPPGRPYTYDEDPDGRPAV